MSRTQKWKWKICTQMMISQTIIFHLKLTQILFLMILIMLRMRKHRITSNVSHTLQCPFLALEILLDLQCLDKFTRLHNERNNQFVRLIITFCKRKLNHNRLGRMIANSYFKMEWRNISQEVKLLIALQLPVLKPPSRGPLV